MYSYYSSHYLYGFTQIQYTVSHALPLDWSETPPKLNTQNESFIKGSVSIARQFSLQIPHLLLHFVIPNTFQHDSNQIAHMFRIKGGYES